MLIKTTLSVNFDHEHAGVLEDPAVRKTWTVLKRSARSVGRKKQSKSPWIRGTTSVSHFRRLGSRLVRVLKRSHSANELSKCNKIQACLQLFFLFDAWKASRCVAVLRRSFKRVEVRNRGSQTRFANASTCSMKSLPRLFFFMTYGWFVRLHGLLRSGFLAQGPSETLNRSFASQQGREKITRIHVSIQFFLIKCMLFYHSCITSTCFCNPICF